MLCVPAFSILIRLLLLLEPASNSTQIKWKEGMDFTKHSQDQSAKAGKKRPLSVPRSFFGWFADNSDASADDIAEVRIFVILLGNILGVLVAGLGLGLGE